MGLVSNLLLLPLRGPLDGTVWIAGKIAEATERQMNDKTVLRQRLREAERQLESGEIDEDTYDEIENDILLRLRAAGR